MQIKKIYIVGAVAALLTIIVDVFLFRGSAGFYFILGIAAVFGLLPFIMELVGQNQKEQAINSMFLEFSRNLAESVNTGTPISKSIINMSKKNYGELTPYIQKLANQISLGISVNKAMATFAYDVNNPVIKRAVALISEAERAGGEIDYILESVAKSISEVEKLKKERKAAISTLVVQGYIIFFIFIGIMLVMQYKILPLTAGLNSIQGDNFQDFGTSAVTQATGGAITPEDMTKPFLYLLLTQGFFIGLTMGKLTEGKILAGVKHSFVMVLTAFLVSTGVKLLLG
jgi:flagellar protein FlaJ